MRYSTEAREPSRTFLRQFPSSSGHVLIVLVFSRKFVGYSETFWNVFGEFWDFSRKFLKPCQNTVGPFRKVLGLSKKFLEFPIKWVFRVVLRSSSESNDFFPESSAFFPRSIAIFQEGFEILPESSGTFTGSSRTFPGSFNTFPGGYDTTSKAFITFPKRSESSFFWELK